MNPLWLLLIIPASIAVGFVSFAVWFAIQMFKGW